MTKTRTLIVLAIALALGLVAARMVLVWLKKPPAPHPVAKKEPAAAPDPDVIPEGMRVVSIRVDDASGGPQTLKPGDRVDVVATSPLADAGGNLSRMILENVAVHRTGDKAAKSKALGPSTRGSAVALLLAPDQAVRLIAAAKGAELTLLARSRKDNTGSGVPGRVLYTREQGVQVLPAASLPMACQIPGGMRAVTLKLGKTDGLCGRLLPGDRVDLLFTSQVAFVQAGEDYSPGATAKLSKYEYATHPLLDNVQVLGTETAFETGAAPTQPVHLVSLLVTAQQALKLAAAVDSAAKGGRIRLVARHPDDERPAGTRKERLSDLLSRQREVRRVILTKGLKVREIPFFQ